MLGNVTGNKLRQELTQVVVLAYVLAYVLGNTAGFVCFQTLKNEVAGFRVAATGVITDLDCGHAKVVKKLKLVGEPKKIFKNTCFVKGMFSTALEVPTLPHSRGSRHSHSPPRLRRPHFHPASIPTHKCSPMLKYAHVF